MKIIKYNVDERKVLHKAIWMDNKELSSEYIDKVIDDCFTKKDFRNFTCLIKLENHGMCINWIDNKTQEHIHNKRDLPVCCWDIDNKIFDKLYWQYCN